MWQCDVYKASLKPEVRDDFKDDHIKLVVSPAECIDANSSVVDCNVRETLKKKVDEKLDTACELDPE